MICDDGQHHWIFMTSVVVFFDQCKLCATLMAVKTKTLEMEVEERGGGNETSRTVERSLTFVMHR